MGSFRGMEFDEISKEELWKALSEAYKMINILQEENSDYKLKELLRNEKHSFLTDKIRNIFMK